MTRFLTVTILTILTALLEVNAQMSTAFHWAPNNQLGIGYNFGKKLWGEIRISSLGEKSRDKGSLNNSDIELSLNYLIAIRDGYFGYVGIGTGGGSDANVILPVGIMVTPWQEINRLKVQFEISPHISFTGIEGDFNTADDDIGGGVSYSFGIRYFLSQLK